MTPMLLPLAFLLVVDVLIATTHGMARTGSRAAQPRLARRPLRPSDGKTAVESTRHGTSFRAYLPAAPGRRVRAAVASRPG
jgi:hypothetical protein